MPTLSPFDKLHDRLFKADPSKPINKAGTRYERLMAEVVRALHENHAVIHDIRLRGESDVKHQIDVFISSNEMSAPQRLLIECKDLSISEDKVGLSIVRDFSAVVDDIKPTSATIVTCVGFTEDAIKFAAHKGIRLCTLQIYDRKSDRIEGVGINLTLLWPEVKHAEFLADVESQRKIHEAFTKAGASDLAADDADVREIPVHDELPAYIRFAGQHLQVMEHMRNLVRAFIKGWMGIGEKTFEWTESAVIEIGDEAIPVAGIKLVVEQEATEGYFTIVGKGIAELVLRYLDEDEERVIYREELGTPPASNAEPES